MLRDGLSSLLEKPRSQCGTGSSKPCTTTACLGSARLGGLVSLVCLCTSGELDSMECFIDPSYLVLATQAVPGRQVMVVHPGLLAYTSVFVFSPSFL